MIKSMTGYGKVNFENEAFTLSAEVKTLNSKFLDAGIRLPRIFSEREIEVRNLLSSHLERGKVMLTVEYVIKNEDIQGATINGALLKNYYQILDKLSKEVGNSHADVFALAMQLPEVVQPPLQETASEVVWEIVKNKIEEAIQHCNAFRVQEGKALGQHLESCIKAIGGALEKVEVLVPKRNEAVRTKIRTQLEELISESQIDENRFEQELIYYIEKLDMNEEIVRLKNHLSYFLKVMQSKDSQGKKLGFISQEIGREINTIGSKANDSEMQHLVVSMKEELEKIKEQVLNVI
jgi:uncharacterized protein (TIGR00255 family)